MQLLPSARSIYKKKKNVRQAAFFTRHCSNAEMHVIHATLQRAFSSSLIQVPLQRIVGSTLHNEHASQTRVQASVTSGGGVGRLTVILC